MVSLITQGSSTDHKGRTFSRRRPVPILVVLVVLALAGAAVWFRILTATETSTDTIACNAPPAATDSSSPAAAEPGTEVDGTVVTDTQPLPLSATRVRVFNANGQGGQAAEVAADLSEYGFASAPDVQVGNDPVYVDQNMQCNAQIRFGQSGIAAAGTVALVAPCAEFIQDTREDDTVDLALGTNFRALQPNTDGEEVVRSLAEVPPGSAAPTLDIELLAAAHAVDC
ncbi:MAG: envelope integrity protein Cei [Rhodococcus sp. (in: high G+C Gram-positive bacteria)]